MLALEAQNVTVQRFTIRPFTELLDDIDRDEAEKTFVLLNVPKIVVATITTVVTRFVSFVRAFKLAWRTGRNSQRGLLYNFIYLAEACYLRQLLAERGVQHLHSHFGTNGTTVAMLTRELGGPPYSFTCHGPEEFDRPEALALGEKVTRSAFAVAISSFGRSQLCRWVGFE